MQLHLNYPLPQRKPGNSMQLANVVEDLGVFIDNSFSPSIHCKEAAFKARWMLFVIRRLFAELSVSAFAPIYNTLAWPHLEYAMQACSSNLVAEAYRLERTHWLVTRLVKGFRRLPYEELLCRLDLHSIRRRRQHFFLFRHCGLA